MTQQFVETNERRQASRNWAAMRKNYKALRRVDNRNAFTATVTVVKQAPTFKSVGAAAYNSTSSKLHAAVADEITQNKVDKEVVQASESITQQGVSMSELSDIIVKHGGIHLCDIKLNDKPVFSVQYHPESSAGPHDSRYLFDQFIENMKNHKS
jgi:Na+-translocating ferredoxin:NAD+ oxidoreductase RnfG subunit